MRQQFHVRQDEFHAPKYRDVLCLFFLYKNWQLWLVFRLLWENVPCMGLDYCNLNKAFTGRWETMSTFSKAEISRPQWFPKQFLNWTIEEEAAPLKCLFILNMSEFSPSTFQQSLCMIFNLSNCSVVFKIYFNYRWDPARTLIGQTPIFYQKIKHRKACFIVFCHIASISYTNQEA